MLSGTHRNSLQEQVIYGRPALEALTDLAKAFGAHRLMFTSTTSLAGPGGLAQRLAEDSGAACVGIFAGVSAHSPREGVIAGAAEARRLGADLLVAVGGGSVIDATKVMQLALWAGVESVEGLGAYRIGPGPDRADVSRRETSVTPAKAAVALLGRQKLVAALLGNPELSASDAVKALAHALDLPTDLAAIGISPGHFRAIAEHTLHDRGIRSNPRAIKGADDIMEILELAWCQRGGRS